MSTALEQYQLTRALGGWLDGDEMKAAVRLGYQPSPAELIHVGQSGWVREHGVSHLTEAEAISDIWWGLGKVPMVKTVPSTEHFHGWTTLHVDDKSARQGASSSPRFGGGVRVMWAGWRALLSVTRPDEGTVLSLFEPADTVRKHGTDAIEGLRPGPAQWRMSDIITRAPRFGPPPAAGGLTVSAECRDGIEEYAWLTVTVPEWLGYDWRDHWLIPYELQRGVVFMWSGRSKLRFGYPVAAWNPNPATR